MHRLCRFLLVALMLVLLPLRGWAGNVMAVDMAAVAVQQVKMVTMTSQAAMPADCIMQSQAPTDDVAAQCCSCDTCELCLAVANLATALWTASPLTRHSSPLAFNASYSSATSATHLKPPIF